MSNNNTKRPKERMVHVRLTEELHKRLRIRAAENDTTLQDWVARIQRSSLERYYSSSRVLDNGGRIPDSSRQVDNMFRGGIRINLDLEFGDEIVSTTVSQSKELSV